MGLQINSGPKWEDDTLNDLNIESIEKNAKKMARRPGRSSSWWLTKEKEEQNGLG
jgi:hypothetical protein